MEIVTPTNKLYFAIFAPGGACFDGIDFVVTTPRHSLKHKTNHITKTKPNVGVSSGGGSS